METTIKISKETKKRILSLDLAEKGKSFDMIVNELVSSYQKSKVKYINDYKKWEQSFKIYEKEMIKHQESVKKYKKEEKVWEKLLLWAKTKGFNP